MPFSLLMTGYPTADIPTFRVQGPAIQGMFMELLNAVDPAVTARLHDDSRYRPYTLSPLGVGKIPTLPLKKGAHGFQGFWLPKDETVQRERPCYIRITLLEDHLFPVFSRYFLSRAEPTFRLGHTRFVVTNVMVTQGVDNSWSTYKQYHDLIEHASTQRSRKISLHFLTPTSFRRGDVDCPLPDPRLVFGSYRRRFEEFYEMHFLENFDTLVERYTGISYMKQIQTELITTKKVNLVGFTGQITYQIDRRAPDDLDLQMNLLADYAFFCGTGRKTTFGMGQTVRSG